MKRLYLNSRYFPTHLSENGRIFFILLYLLLLFDISDIDQDEESDPMMFELYDQQMRG